MAVAVEGSLAGRCRFYNPVAVPTSPSGAARRTRRVSPRADAVAAIAAGCRVDAFHVRDAVVSPDEPLTADR